METSLEKLPNLEALQHDLAFVDMYTERKQNTRSDVLELLLLKKEQLKLKMYQEQNHGRAHFHVDYGTKNHSASYAVDTGERLDGSLPRKYDRAISQWAAKNRDGLFST
jgi:Domain of unknown function (DUF4160)